MYGPPEKTTHTHDNNELRPGGIGRYRHDMWLASLQWHNRLARWHAPRGAPWCSHSRCRVIQTVDARSSRSWRSSLRPSKLNPDRRNRQWYLVVRQLASGQEAWAGAEERSRSVNPRPSVVRNKPSIACWVAAGPGCSGERTREFCAQQGGAKTNVL